MKLQVHQYRLVLEHPFTISRRSFSHQDNLIVELSDGHYSGFGEATFNPYYPNTNTAAMAQLLRSLQELIESQAHLKPKDFWQVMYEPLQDWPFALCALDQARHDLYARQQGLPLYQSWGLKLDQLPITCYTLGIDAIPVLIERIRQQPWPIYKVKLGTPNDLEIIRALREHTDAVLRVDANCAWTVEETIEKSKVLKELGVEFIEQPLAAEDWEGMKKVFEQSALPIIADESCRTAADIQKCQAYFHGVNIKLMKCGGLSPALEMIREAHELGLQVMVGCMTESTVGISAIAHLLPLLDYVDMDGALFLKEDIAEGVEVNAKGVIFPDRNGTGVRLISSK
ncbi:MAG: dipeptide epimerase [Bacteroidota bacterium]